MRAKSSNEHTLVTENDNPGDIIGIPQIADVIHYRRLQSASHTY